MVSMPKETLNSTNFFKDSSNLQNLVDKSFPIDYNNIRRSK